MKTTKQISIMMAVVLLSFSIISCKDPIPPRPDGMKLINNTITLYVKTDKIDDTNKDTTCNFKQPDSVSNENFTTLVHLGDEITWVGESSIEGDLVEIKLIKRDKGDRILKKKRYSGDTKVAGKVRSYGNKDDVEKYLIRFTVYNNGIKRGKYEIDPKLQIGS